MLLQYLELRRGLHDSYASVCSTPRRRLVQVYESLSYECMRP
jgi:hypothetical protein